MSTVETSGENYAKIQTPLLNKNSGHNWNKKKILNLERRLVETVRWKIYSFPTIHDVLILIGDTPLKQWRLVLNTKNGDSPYLLFNYTSTAENQAARRYTKGDTPNIKEATRLIMVRRHAWFSEGDTPNFQQATRLISSRRHAWFPAGDTPGSKKATHLQTQKILNGSMPWFWKSKT